MSSNVKRIVVVYPGRLVPGSNGGAMRVRAVAQHIRAKGGRVILISYDQPQSHDLLSELADSVNLFTSALRVERHDAPERREHLSSLARNMNVEFHGFAREIIAKEKPDAVMAVFAWTAPVLYGLPEGVLRIIDTIDVQHLRYEVAQAHGGCLDDKRCSLEEELHCLEMGNVIMAIQREERDLFLKLGVCGERVICCEHAMPVSIQCAPVGSQTVLFVGNSYDPNIRGIQLFIEKHWENVREECPDARLVVCGTVCSDIWGLAGMPGVCLKGVVPSVKTYYEEAAIVINPSLYGTGLPIKTVEALSAGKTLVGLKNTVRGLDEKMKSVCDIVPSLEKLQKHVVKWLQQPKLRQQQEQQVACAIHEALEPDYIYAELDRELAQCKAPADAEWPRRFTRAEMQKIYPEQVVSDYWSARWLSHAGRPLYSRRELSPQFVEQHVRMRWQLMKCRDGIDRIALMGAGQHTQWLEYVVGQSDGPEVVAVADMCSGNEERLFFGCKCSSPDALKHLSIDAVVLSTDCWQRDMCLQCRNIIGSDVPLVDLYEGLPPGPYPKL